MKILKPFFLLLFLDLLFISINNPTWYFISLSLAVLFLYVLISLYFQNLDLFDFVNRQLDIILIKDEYMRKVFYDDFKAKHPEKFNMKVSIRRRFFLILKTLFF